MQAKYEFILKKIKNKLIKKLHCINQLVILRDVTASHVNEFSLNMVKEDELNLFDRLMKQILHLSTLAIAQHFIDNFDDQRKIKPDCLNKITRFTFNEFSFYPSKSNGPFSISQFNTLIIFLEQIALNYPDNFHLLLSSFPVRDEKNTVYNVSCYIQCGVSPAFNLITKTIPDGSDPNYSGTHNYGYEYADDNGVAPPFIAEHLVTDKTKTQQVAWQYGGNIPCRTAGGAEFTTIVDVCLDHLYSIGKLAYLIQREHAIQNLENFIPEQISHIITSNWVDIRTDNVVSSEIVNASTEDHSMKWRVQPTTVINPHFYKNIPAPSFGSKTKMRDYPEAPLSVLSGDLNPFAHNQLFIEVQSLKLLYSQYPFLLDEINKKFKEILLSEILSMCDSKKTYSQSDLMKTRTYGLKLIKNLPINICDRHFKIQKFFKKLEPKISDFLNTYKEQEKRKAEEKENLRIFSLFHSRKKKMKSHVSHTLDVEYPSSLRRRC